MSQSSTDLLNTLQAASQGLLFLSESEAPFETFLWQGQANEDLTPEKLAQQTGHPADTSVQVMELSDFFRPASAWFGPEEQEMSDRFKQLESTIATSLNKVKVYRVGQIEIDVYIVGQHANDLLGLSTQVVET